MPEEVRKAIDAVKIARNHMDHCDPELLDVCLYRLIAAEKYLSVIIKKTKKQAA